MAIEVASSSKSFQRRIFRREAQRSQWEFDGQNTGEKDLSSS
jgi:hypothetical protein